MRDVDSLVEVTVVKLEKGSNQVFAELEELTFFGNDEEGLTVELPNPPVDQSGEGGLPVLEFPVDCYMLEDAYGFEFVGVGEWGAAPLSCAAEYEASEVGWGEVMEPFAKELVAMAEAALQGVTGRGGEPAIASFITAWSYHVSHDPFGESDAEFELLGRLRLDKLEGAIEQA